MTIGSFDSEEARVGKKKAACNKPLGVYHSLVFEDGIRVFKQRLHCHTLGLHVRHFTFNAQRSQDRGCENDREVERCHLCHVSSLVSQLVMEKIVLPNSLTPA